jgi:hypothetical protein
MISRDDIKKYEVIVRSKYNLLKKKINISNDIQHEAALKSEKVRLLNIVDNPYAIELLNNEVLSFNHLDSVTSLEAATKTIDKYIEITNFYERNYKAFYWLINRDQHIKNKLRGGNLDNWQELLDSPVSYKNFNHEQSTAYVMYRLNHPEHEPHHHFIQDNATAPSQDKIESQNKFTPQQTQIKPYITEEPAIMEQSVYRRGL